MQRSFLASWVRGSFFHFLAICIYALQTRKVTYWRFFSISSLFRSAPKKSLSIQTSRNQKETSCLVPGLSNRLELGSLFDPGERCQLFGALDDAIEQIPRAHQTVARLQDLYQGTSENRMLTLGTVEYRP